MTDHPPRDWKTPEWEKATPVHDWRNYAQKDLRANWLRLPEEFRKIVAANLQAIADREEWE